MIDGTEKPKIPSTFAKHAAQYNEFRCIYLEINVTRAEMPTSGDLKSGDSLFSISPLPPGNLGHYIKSYMK